MTPNESAIAAAEGPRIKTVYARRATERAGNLYAPWQPAEHLLISERKRVAAKLLRSLDRFPIRGDKCLEIDYGRIG